MAVGHIGGRVILVARTSVQDGEADVQDVLFKLLPEKLHSEARVLPTSQALPRPHLIGCLCLCQLASAATGDIKILLQRVIWEPGIHFPMTPHDGP